MARNPKPLRRQAKVAATERRRQGFKKARARALRMAWLRKSNYPGAVHHRRKMKRPWRLKEVK